MPQQEEKAPEIGPKTTVSSQAAAQADILPTRGTWLGDFTKLSEGEWSEDVHEVSTEAGVAVSWSAAAELSLGMDALSRWVPSGARMLNTGGP